MPSSRQAMTATTSYFVYEGASITQEHVERDVAVKVLQLHNVGGIFYRCRVYDAGKSVSRYYCS